MENDWGRPLAMPTDFDDFTPAAMLRYTGRDPLVRNHLYLLQTTMADAGFYGLRTEWWHFTTSDWKRYVPERLAKLVTPSSSPQLNDRVSSRPPAATGIRSHPHQSSTDLRLGDKLDRLGNCVFSAEPACANRNASSRFNQCRCGLAGL